MIIYGLGDFKKEKKHSLKIPVGGVKVPVLALERIIKSKKATGRQKDKLVLPVLSDALIAIRESGSVIDNIKKY